MRAGGDATVNWQVNAQTQKDLLLMESVALPLSFLVLVWVFGGLVAAALPVAVGVFAILGSLASLHVISLFTDVSIFALNLAVAMGMALAVDYTLLILSRFRDELAQGQTRDAALIRTMATAGRTVLFSAMTVALSMATMVLFPQYFLKSFAYAGTAVVAFAAAAAITVTPAAIMLLDRRLDSLDVRPLTRRILWGSAGRPARSERWSWYRWTKSVMRHAVPIGLAVIALLLLLGSPFQRRAVGICRRPDTAHLGFGTPGGRPTTQQLCRTEGPRMSPSCSRMWPTSSPAELDGYAAALSRVPDVTWVSGLGGTFVDGGRSGPASAPVRHQGRQRLRHSGTHRTAVHHRLNHSA